MISPLISLMKDQVSALNQVGILAAFLNEEFLDFALHVKISMIAVDEAHCVSQWRLSIKNSKIPKKRNKKSVILAID